MIESLKRNWKGMVLMLISALTLSIGSFLWKRADLGDIGTAVTSIQGIFGVFLKILPGFIVYVMISPGTVKDIPRLFQVFNCKLMLIHALF